MLPCDQVLDHPVDRTFGAILFPFGVDRGVDQAALGIVEAVDMATHLTDDRLQHGDAIEPIIFVALRLRRVDHREGIEAETRAHRELDECATLQLAAMLEAAAVIDHDRSEEHTSELQSLMRISYAVFCLKTKNQS